MSGNPDELPKPWSVEFPILFHLAIQPTIALQKLSFPQSLFIPFAS
jgi:hypothetical protein